MGFHSLFKEKDKRQNLLDYHNLRPCIISTISNISSSTANLVNVGTHPVLWKSGAYSAQSGLVPPYREQSRTVGHDSNDEQEPVPSVKQNLESYDRNDSPLFPTSQTQLTSIAFKPKTGCDLQTFNYVYRLVLKEICWEYTRRSYNATWRII